jgi:hypothetical protein
MGRKPVALAVLTLLSLATTGCAHAQSTQGVTAMFDTLMSIARRADAVVYGTVEGTQRVTVEGEEFLRARTGVREAFAGPPQASRDIAVDVRVAGKETPALETGADFVFFLKAAGAPPDAVWHLVDLSRPVAVPAKEREAFLRCMRETVEVGRSNPDQARIKRHIIDMLESRLPFFQSDAARTALGVDDWSDDELKRLMRIVAGDEHHEPLRGNERDNLVSVVLSRGAPDTITPFARTQIRSGGTDAVYYGLFNRKQPGTDEVLWALLKDADPRVQEEALRVAGLLRREDTIDEFARRHPEPNEELRGAIEAARRLAERD